MHSYLFMDYIHNMYIYYYLHCVKITILISKVYYLIIAIILSCYEAIECHQFVYY